MDDRRNEPVEKPPPASVSDGADAFEAWFVERLRGEVGEGTRVAIAVSGGGDSMALLRLAAAVRRAIGVEISALTVDHGLRADSAREAALVGRWCAARKLPHDVLTWAGPVDPGNLQAAAREGRYALMRAWRRREGVGPLLTAHTEDDVAETFLMRLARGSGVDGLSQMAARVVEDADADPPLILLRPLLDVSRAALRAYAEARGAPWVEDPSNVDLRFDRAKARQALETLRPLGLDPPRLAKTARNMARARTTLEHATNELLRRASVCDPVVGFVTLDRTTLAAADEELALRALARTLVWVSGAAYPPSLEPLEEALTALLRGVGRSLHGCLCAASADGERLWIAREPARAAAPEQLTPGVETLWDRRFLVVAAQSLAQGEIHVGALGAAEATRLKNSDDASEAARRWRAAPAAARETIPAVRAGGVLIAAPGAGITRAGVDIDPRRTPFIAG